jgi:hypothetical protein
MNATWTTSSNSPSLLNLVFGSGTDGTTPTIVASDGTSYTGYGRTNFNILNGNFNMFTVPGQDTAPDNASLTATNSISFVSNRRSGTSGRRNPVTTGDDLGVIIFRGQHVPNGTGTGLRGASISARTLEAFTSTRAGSSLSIATVNSGTTTEAERLFVSDAVMRYRADQHSFLDKSGSFTALTVTTATTTISGALNGTGVYHCEVARSSDQSLTNDSDVVIQFNKTNSDPQSWYNSGTYRITPTVSGYYLVQVQVIWAQGTGASTDQQNIQIRKNGTTFAIAQEELYTGTVAMTQNAVGVVQLNGSSDYIDVTGYNGGSAAQSVKGSTNGEWTKVTLTKLQ